MTNHKSTSITPAQADNAQELLIELIAHHGGYKKTAAALGVTYQYVHQVANGKRLAGGPFYRTIKKMHAGLTPPVPRLRVTISFQDIGEFKLVKALNPGERRAILLAAAREREGSKDHDDRPSKDGQHREPLRSLSKPVGEIE